MGKPYSQDLRLQRPGQNRARIASRSVPSCLAALIGGIEALGLISSKLNLTGAFWRNLASFGFVIIAVFLLSWIIWAFIYRWKRFNRLVLGNQ